jgi:H+/Cl- antiporter ClcA
MIDTQARPRGYARLLVLATVIGAVAALVTFAFVYLVDKGIALIWENAAMASGLPAPAWTLLICSLGGLVVGLLVRVFGDHSGIFVEVMREFGRTGRFDYRNAPGIVLTALVSLVSGASLGPEAPLADANGGIGTWLADRLHADERETRSLSYSGVSGMLGAFITSPVGGALLALESAQGGGSMPSLYFWVLFPSLIAAASATLVFVALTGSFFSSLYSFPEYVPGFRDLLQAVPLGIIGGVVGVVFFVLLQLFQRAIQPMKNRLVLRGLLGGLALGIAGALFPLVLFSGEEQTVELIDRAAEIGVPMLLALAGIKLLITCVILVCGWKGGYVFPIMFVGVALGLAVNLIFPQIPVAVAVAATIAGSLAATMRAPLFAIFFAGILVQREAMPAIAVASVAGSIVAAVAVLWSARRAKAAAPPMESATP